MNVQAEIGYDYPGPGPSRPRSGKLARRLIIALIVGILAGLAITLQIRGWGTLGSESGGACGTSDQGVSYGACPRGITPALLISFLIGLPAVPAAIVLLFKKGWARRGLLVIGAVGGVLAGQSLFGVWHGTDLAIAWAAPKDASPELTTVGAWTSGGSLIRVRVDEAVSYDAATGRQQWLLQMPGVDVACGVSGTSSSAAIGLIAYGQDSTTCDHVMAVDLATGRQLWSDPVQNPYSGNSPAGSLAIAAGRAIVLTDDGIAGVSTASGAQKWTLAPPTGCVYEQIAASGDSAIAVAACDASYYAVSIDPTSGKALWRYHVTEPSASYQFQILAASPVVISDDLPGPRGTSMIRVFGSDGRETSAFSDSGIPLAGTTVALNTATDEGFAAPVAVADGMLVGVTTVAGSGDAIAGYRLADGKRLWLVNTPDEVHDVALSGSDLVFVDESDPDYSLEEVGITTGTLRSLGYFTQGVLDTGESGLFTADGDYLVVNQNSDSFTQTPVAAIPAPVSKG